MNATAAWRQRWQGWAQRRLPPADAVTLTQRTIYVLPSRPGLTLAATLLALLATSINYELNLGYLLTFLLTGSGLVSLLIGHRTLRALALSLISPEPQFAGTPARLRIRLHNTLSQTRHGIGLAVWGSRNWAWTDVPAQGDAQVQIGFDPGRRGLHALPMLTVETRFPLGTFRVWALWQPAARVLIYPAPEAHPPPLPQGEPSGPERQGGQRASGSEFDGVRAYRRGDPMKQVVWKKAASTGELVSRDLAQTQGMALWLDIRHTGVHGTELQLSRLCAWVLQAELGALEYGLRLGATVLPPNRGDAHKRRCLEALAQY